MSKFNDVLGAVYRKEVETLRQLTREDMNLRDKDGRIPLMHAVLAEDADPAIVKLLIERGADVNAADEQKWTALHFAAQDQKAVMVRVLLEAGAAADALDRFGDTPLWRAMRKTANLEVIRELLARGADPLKKNIHGVAPIDLARTFGRDDLVALFKSKGVAAELRRDATDSN